MQQPSHSKYGLRRQWAQGLNRTLGEMNAFLCALAIGLAVLDLTCFMTLTVSAEIKKAHQSVLSAKSPGAKFATSMVDFSIQ